MYGIFACLVFSSIVCLVCSFRYWFLAASRLVARFARVRALRARCGPFGLAAGAIEGAITPLLIMHWGEGGHLLH